MLPPPGSLTRCMSRKLTSADVISTVSLYIKLYLDLSMTHQMSKQLLSLICMDSVVVDIILTNTYSEPITLTTLGARAGTWRAESDRYWREWGDMSHGVHCVTARRVTSAAIITRAYILNQPILTGFVWGTRPPIWIKCYVINNMKLATNFA